jgi:hypothetical protein
MKESANFRTNGADIGDVDRASPHDAAAPRIEAAIRLARQIPRQLDAQVRTRPVAALATVGGVSFVAGMFLGSRLGRAAFIAALGYGVKVLVDRDLVPELGRIAKKALTEGLST